MKPIKSIAGRYTTDIIDAKHTLMMDCHYLRNGAIVYDVDRAYHRPWYVQRWRNAEHYIVGTDVVIGVNGVSYEDARRVAIAFWLQFFEGEDRGILTVDLTNGHFPDTTPIDPSSADEPNHHTGNR